MSRKITFTEAIREGISQEMDKDKNIQYHLVRQRL